ncbi:FBD-associated F-box protein At4g10400-like [Trifolium pratense]|uniref:FBD-associated F-box protein At4g10400-like n=1 Tax=Trifolium pratense TaxID=57577 RepID=UPI001E695106|nr:FBD-associated F-box protein At4g10400-like [Trifolium pratense]
MSHHKLATDRISGLPDEILCHILSFIPTKQAIFTSILSKRWIHLWRHVPALYFINKKLNSSQDIHHFNQFVKAVLHSRDNSLSSHSINNLAVQSKIQYLHLYLHARLKCETIPPKLPASILSCTTLVVLNLSWFYVDKVSPFPLRFPSLKTLDLKDMNFDKCQDFMLLLDGCPVLEDLQLSYIHFIQSFRHFDFEQFENSSLRKLKRAHITDCYFHFPVKALANVEFLRIELWKGYTYLPDGFPTFHNLTHLAVNYDCNLAVQVLQHCPKLRNLELYPKLKYAWRDEYITKDDEELVPICLSSSLTTCTIRDFVSTTLESLIMLATFIMKKARVLKTMTIWSNRKRFSEIESKLSSFPRASATCQLSFQFINLYDT